MKLSEPELQQLRSLAQRWCPGRELELALTCPLTRAQFSAALTQFSNTAGDCHEHEEVLDVTVDDPAGDGHGHSNSHNHSHSHSHSHMHPLGQQKQHAPSSSLRASIRGLHAICEYHKTQRIPDSAVLLAKSRIGQCVIGAYHFKARLADEQAIAASVDALARFRGGGSARCWLRLKKRFSVTTADGLCRADFTVVQSSASTSGPKIERYEVELEYVGKDAVQVDCLLRHMTSLLQCVFDEPLVLSEHERASAVSEYMALVRPHLKPQSQACPRQSFVGCNLVTLRRCHLLRHQPGTSTVPASSEPCVLQGYAVTEKADGQRALLFVAGDGRSYLINNRLRVTSTGLPPKPALAQTLLDCEVVHLQDNNKDGDDGDSGDHGQQRAVLVFDAYYCCNVSQAHNSLVQRMQVYQDLVDQLQPPPVPAHDSPTTSLPSCVVLQAKLHRPYDVSSMPQVVQEVLDVSAQRPYATDGLVFTPVDLAIGASPCSPHVPVLGGTWEQALKWKPPASNSVDFQVRMLGELQLELLVGSGVTTPQEYFRRRGVPDLHRAYFLTPFAPHPVTRISSAVCEDGDELLDGQVVEMRYDVPRAQWVPMRIRYDKCDKRAAGDVTANSMTNALAVWQSIQYPVSEQHITLLQAVLPQDLPPKGDAYYARAVERSRCRLQGLLAFHNYWIKEQTLLRPARRCGPALLDIGCGKGGDLPKWLRCGYSTVLGVDVSEDNLCNPRDGAYRRLAECRGSHHLRCAFLALDASQPIYLQHIRDPYMRSVAQVLYDDGSHHPGQPQSQSQAPSELLHLRGMAARPAFDVVSCQFTLHYFFKDRATLHTFVDNVLRHLRPDGLLVGTCFDGRALSTLFQSGRTRAESVQGSTLAWAIEKKYDGAYDPMAFGQRVGVYVESINQHIDEYLVGFELLQQELSERGLRLLNPTELQRYGMAASTAMFEDTFADMQRQAALPAPDAQSRHPAVLQQALRMEGHEQEFSFLSRWFMFIRDPQTVQQSQSQSQPAAATSKRTARPGRRKALA